MTVPDTRNARIALAKGWKAVEIPTSFSLSPSRHTIQKWQPPNPHSSLVDEKDLPDYVDTLKGVAELMADLNEHAKADHQYWIWGQNAYGCVFGPRDAYYCAKHGQGGLYLRRFWSEPDRPGDCVGDAYLSVFGKESDD